jgi:hypothetical protein
LPLAADRPRQLVHALRRLLYGVNSPGQLFAGVQAAVQLLHLHLLQPLQLRLLSFAVFLGALELSAEVLALTQLAILLRAAIVGMRECSLFQQKP